MAQRKRPKRKRTTRIDVPLARDNLPTVEEILSIVTDILVGDVSRHSAARLRAAIILLRHHASGTGAAAERAKALLQDLLVSPQAKRGKRV